MFFDYLSELGLNDSNLDSVTTRWKDDKIRGLMELMRSSLPAPDETVGSYRFATNTPMGGGPFPCSHANCRIERVGELARFAALYADSVVLSHPADAYPASESEMPLSPLIVRRLVEDLKVLFHLRPLVDTGIVRFGESKFLVCSNCLMNADLKTQMDELKGLREKFTQLLAPDVRIELGELRDGPTFRIIAPPRLQPLLPKQGILAETFREFMSQHDLKAGDILTPTQADESRLLSHLLDVFFDDMFRQDLFNRSYNTHYITDRTPDLDMFGLSQTSESKQWNENVYNALSHSLPYLDKLGLKTLAELRQAYEPEFVLYRAAMKKAMMISGENASAQEMLEAFEDLVRPELSKIDIAFKEAQRISTRSITGAVLAVGAIGVGVHRGLIPNDLATLMIAGCSGHLLEAASDVLTKKIGPLTQDTAEMKRNDFYFLWKVKQRAKK